MRVMVAGQLAWNFNCDFIFDLLVCSSALKKGLLPKSVLQLVFFMCSCFVSESRSAVASNQFNDLHCVHDSVSAKCSRQFDECQGPQSAYGC